MMYASGTLPEWLMANNVAWKADLYKVTLRDGTVYRWTTCDGNLVFGGSTWLANGAVKSRGRIRKTSRLEVDSVDLTLFSRVVVGGNTIARLGIIGAFDEARIQIDRILGAFPGDTTKGHIPAWFEGRVGQLRPGPFETTLALHSDIEELGNVLLPKAIYGAQCANVVYDAGCALVRADWTLSGTVSSATTKTLTTATSAITAKAAGYFDLGVLVFTSGALSGLRVAIPAGGWNGTTFTFPRAFLGGVAPSDGDSFTVVPGCRRLEVDCKDKFNNWSHNRQFIHIPTPEGAE